MTWPQGVSALAGLICLVIAALIWFVGGKHTPRLIVLLVLTGTAGLLGTPAGGWLRTAVGWLSGATGTVTGRLTGVVVVGLVALVAIYVLVIHLRGGRADVKTIAAAVVTPAAVTTIPGPVGALASGAIGAVTGGVGAGVGAMFGLG